MYATKEDREKAIAYIMANIAGLITTIDDDKVSKIEFALTSGSRAIERRASRKVELAEAAEKRRAFYAALAEDNGVVPDSRLAKVLHGVVYSVSKGSDVYTRTRNYEDLVEDASSMTKEEFTDNEFYDGLYEGYTFLLYEIWELVNKRDGMA